MTAVIMPKKQLPSPLPYVKKYINHELPITDSVQYATPLVAYANFTSFLLDGIGGPNRIIPQQTLSDPSVRNVVKPNVDTVYTLSFIDLSQSDLVITVPEISDGRYWSFPFYDP